MTKAFHGTFIFSFSQYVFQDFQSQLYEAYYMNFISAISRQKLEDIALSAIQSNCVASVSKVKMKETDLRADYYHVC